MSKETAIKEAIKRTNAEIKLLRQRVVRLKSGFPWHEDVCPIDIGDDFTLYKDGKPCGHGHMMSIYPDGDISFYINELGVTDTRDFMLNGKIHSGKFPYLPI